MLQPDLPEPELKLDCVLELLDEEAVQVEPLSVEPEVEDSPKDAELLDELEQLPWLESVDASPNILGKPRKLIADWLLQSVRPGQLT